MMDPTPQVNALEARLVELEIRSEERCHDIERLQRFVEGYEQRVTRLEKELRELRSLAETPSEAMPPPSEDLPPHY
jgi:uncharacterized coiled-coil protein SlyX